jgi:hypothetical protein
MPERRGKFAHEFIDAAKAHYPVVKMCAWMEVSTSGFSEWRGRPASATAARRPTHQPRHYHSQSWPLPHAAAECRRPVRTTLSPLVLVPGKHAMQPPALPQRC